MSSRDKPHKPNLVLIITILILVIFGLIAVATASSVISFEQYGDNLAMLKNQVTHGVILGLIALGFFAWVPYKFWKKFSVLIMAITLLLLVAVFIPHVGVNFGGAQRWLNLGIISFQPSELTKLTMILFLAAWLDKRGQGIKEFTTGVVPFVVIMGVVAALIIAQPDLGTLTVIAVSAVAMFFVAGARLWHIGALFTAALGFLAVAIKLEPYRLQRFTIFLNPTSDPQGAGYQINQALLAIGSGGLLGVGLGQSRQKFNYLPEPAGDSIFAILAEELGFIRIVLVLFVFLLLAYQGFLVARKSPDNFGRLLATGITTWFVAQAFINVGALIGVLPLTGIPLPFVSFGGTALFVSLAAAGILINISRYTKEGAAKRRVPWSLRRRNLTKHYKTISGGTN